MRIPGNMLALSACRRCRHVFFSKRSSSGVNHQSQTPSLGWTVRIVYRGKEEGGSIGGEM